MPKVLFLLLSLLLSSLNVALAESSITLLDNRFRVDPHIEKISFIIYRAKRSTSVVLVRPDGEKYYAWKHPESVTWYEENGLDIVSIDNPMPGPWQAIGRVTPKNHIKLLTNLKLHLDSFPERLYVNERLKFTARLTQDGEPLVLRDFLDRVRLRVSFIKIVEGAESENMGAALNPDLSILGTFADDGRGLDEASGDGIFTVEIPINVAAGKYRAIITSGNGVFLRSVEQTVLVYPSPISVKFTQSREEGVDHRVVIAGEGGMILPGTLAVHIERDPPVGAAIVSQGTAEEGALSIELSMKNDHLLGTHRWRGTAYATEGAANRSLVVTIPENSYSVVDEVKQLQSSPEYLKQEEAKRQAIQQARLLQERKDAQMQGMLMILIGNLVVIVIGLIIWFVLRKIKAAKQNTPEMQLVPPPKS